jgi:hypothetical protein
MTAQVTRTDSGTVLVPLDGNAPFLPMRGAKLRIESLVANTSIPGLGAVVEFVYFTCEAYGPYVTYRTQFGGGCSIHLSSYDGASMSILE